MQRRMYKIFVQWLESKEKRDNNQVNTKHLMGSLEEIVVEESQLS
jgi:hypothetical protein